MKVKQTATVEQVRMYSIVSKTTLKLMLSSPKDK